ncbi:MAG: LPP20 family lipoprotein [Roseovarius sp.]|uniref:LPP20 family lipoprotein n=1 Tax=Roseovarius sp. TaxID=1486281 RepID=UPI0026263CD8|nr:LPP20 family lipoprotein [Roseovarius sp.]
MLSRLLRPVLLPLALMPLGACMSPGRAVDALPADASPRTEAVAQLRDDLSGFPVPAAVSAPEIVQFTGLGLSQVSTQPGASINERRLMAIRAARLEAIRDLTEQIHGIRINSESTLHDQVLRSDAVRAVVAGEIRGARTLRITPKGDDSFEVVLALDPDTVRYILRAVRQRG